MSLTTYSGLKDALAAWSTYSDLTAQMDDFVLWADQEIARRLRANVLLASVDLAIGAETIAQPTGFLAFKRLYLDTSPRQRILTTSAEIAMDMAAEFTPATNPTHVAVEGTLLRFAPTFTGAPTGKALYYKRQAAMSADSDTNVVLDAYPYLYLWGALEALYNYKEDDNNADRCGAKFGALIDDINARDARDTMAGPLQMHVRAGSVV